MELAHSNRIMEVSGEANGTVALSSLLRSMDVSITEFFFGVEVTKDRLSFSLSLTIRRDDRGPICCIRCTRTEVYDVVDTLRGRKIAIGTFGSVGPTLLGRRDRARLLGGLYRLPRRVHLTTVSERPTEVAHCTVRLTATFRSFCGTYHIGNRSASLASTELGLYTTATAILQNVLGVLGVSTPRGVWKGCNFVGCGRGLRARSAFYSKGGSLRRVIIGTVRLKFSSVNFSDRSSVGRSPVHRACLRSGTKCFRRVSELGRGCGGDLGVFYKVRCSVFSSFSASRFSCTVNSIRCLLAGGRCINFSHSSGRIREIVGRCFNKGKVTCTGTCCRRLTRLPDRKGFSVVNRLSLVTGRDRGQGFFSRGSGRCVGCTISTVRTLRNGVPFFRIGANTVTENCEAAPCPDITVLGRLGEHNFNTVVSDSYRGTSVLSYNFSSTGGLLVRYNFGRACVLARRKFGNVTV